MILKNVFSVDNDEGKREQNFNFITRSWPPPPLPTMSTKILHTFSFFGAQVIVMLLI
jgi:hypothetical protein